jgi:hypothetical protein
MKLHPFRRSLCTLRCGERGTDCFGGQWASIAVSELLVVDVCRVVK